MFYQHPFPERLCHVQSFATLSRFFIVAAIPNIQVRLNLVMIQGKKIGKVLTILQERFAYAWIPKQHLSIDEGTVPFKGQICFKVYNPNRPVKYGMKTFKLFDFSMGYYLKFDIYVGKTIEEFK